MIFRAKVILTAIGRDCYRDTIIGTEYFQTTRNNHENTPESVTWKSGENEAAGGMGAGKFAVHEEGWWSEGEGESGRWKLFTNLIVRRAFVLRPYCSTLYLNVLLRPIVTALTVQRN